METDKNAVTEKVSVNINTATLARIDILVDNGCYSNRSDFINQAVRELLDRQSSTLDRLIDRMELRTPSFFVGITVFNKEDFKKWAEAGEKISLKGYGLLVLPEDCDELIMETVSEIRVRGRVRCSERIRKVYLPTA